MSLEMSDVKGVGGWLAAGLATIWRFAFKVDEGRLHAALNRIEGKVDTLDTKLDGVSERVVRLETWAEYEDGGNGADVYRDVPRLRIKKGDQPRADRP